MRSLGTIALTDDVDGETCTDCGDDADYGVVTTNNPTVYYCTPDLTAYLDTLKG